MKRTKRQRTTTIVIFLVKTKKINKPIVMDKVSGLADKSNDFANFLTLSRKFFHIIYLTKLVWKMMLSQTKIFSIFPSIIQLGNIQRILTNHCVRETINYIPVRDL